MTWIFAIWTTLSHVWEGSTADQYRGQLLVATYVHDIQAEAVISNFSPIHITKNNLKHFRLQKKSEKCICFFIRLVECPKLAEKYLNLTLKVTFQLQEPSKSAWFFYEYQFRRTFNCQFTSLMKKKSLIVISEILASI